MVLGKLPVPGRPTIWITVRQGPTVLAVGAGGGCLDIFTLIYPFFPLSPSLWETARYRLKYCLKGPLNPKPTNQILASFLSSQLNPLKPQSQLHIFYTLKQKIKTSDDTQEHRMQGPTLGCSCDNEDDPRAMTIPQCFLRKQPS